MKSSTTVAIAGSSLDDGERRFLSTLGEVLGFRIQEQGASDNVDAFLFPRATIHDLNTIRHSELPCFIVASDDTGEPLSGRVEFARLAAVPFPLAGLMVEDVQAGLSRSLPSWVPQATALARKGNGVVWSARDQADRRQHFVSTPLPNMAADEPLHAHLHADRFVPLVPLLAFLREVTEEPGWEEPALQACFMFDDPNLHWTSYGHIDYEELAEHASEHAYHVSLATIPIDGWYVHRPTAELFRRYSRELSLLMHGNDHVAEELAQPSQLLRLSQALERIERLESRAGVSVSRVMAPPHGACSDDSLAHMATLGFEAACISRGSLTHYNRGAAWVRTLGVQPCDVIRGLPVLPRFRLSANCRSSIALSALLRQPIIAVGHHQDVASGMGLLEDLAGFINGLGPVRWASMSTIVRGHHAQRRIGNALHLRLYTRHADVTVPAGVDRLVVHRPWLEGDLSTERLHIVADGTLQVQVDRSCGSTVAAGQRLRIAAVKTSNASVRRTSGSRLWRPWPVVRRLLTESRDRLSPALLRY